MLFRSGDLFEKIASQQKFIKGEAVSLIEELLRALNHCHHLGIIHRDIKPENIVYSNDGTLKLIDFGLAIKEKSYSVKGIVGSQHYIAPEIVKGGLFTTACDIWSLGVVMYVLLCGFLPIVGNSTEEIFENVKSFKTPDFTDKVWKPISNEAKDLLTKLMDPNHKTRITAEEALEHPWFKSKSDRTTFHLYNFLSKWILCY